MNKLFFFCAIIRFGFIVADGESFRYLPSDNNLRSQNNKSKNNHAYNVCNDEKTIMDFHNILKLPMDFTPNKISFRTCVSHTEETVIADIHGSGSIRMLWLVTGLGARSGRPSHCVLSKDALMMVVRIYFDGSNIPSVETPLGPLFGFHHDTKEYWYLNLLINFTVIRY